MKMRGQMEDGESGMCRKLEGGSENSYIEDLEKKAFGPHNIPVEV